MFTQTNVLSSPLLTLPEGLSKVFHDTSLFGDGTRATPLRLSGLLNSNLTWGTTSSFPSINRNNQEIRFRLGDDSDFAPVQSLYQRFGTGSPQGVIAAPVGAIYHRTDGGTGTSFYVKETGGVTSSGWVAK